MANGFQGIMIQSSKKLSIQKPIGFFGISISLANAPNLYITVLTSAGIPLRNTTVTAVNATSGVPDSNSTDGSGNVALKADATTDIILTNGLFTKTYAYDRSIVGNQIQIQMHIPSLI